MGNRADYDGPANDDRAHQIQALFYRKGYLFLIDKFTFKRSEGFGRNYHCDWGSCEAGACTSCWKFTLSWDLTKNLEYEVAFKGTDSYGIGICNYCGGESTELSNDSGKQGRHGA